MIYSERESTSYFEEHSFMLAPESLAVRHDEPILYFLCDWGKQERNLEAKGFFRRAWKLRLVAFLLAERVLVVVNAQLDVFFPGIGVKTRKCYRSPIYIQTKMRQAIKREPKMKEKDERNQAKD